MKWSLCPINYLDFKCHRFVILAHNSLPLTYVCLIIVLTELYRLYKIFSLSDKDNLLQLRQFIGLSSLSKLIEKRCCNFMDRILGDSRYSVLCDAFVSNLCSRFVVI